MDPWFEAHRDSTPHLVMPAIYVANVTTLRRSLRVSRVNDAIHVQYRWPEMGLGPKAVAMVNGSKPHWKCLIFGHKFENWAGRFPRLVAR